MLWTVCLLLDKILKVNNKLCGDNINTPLIGLIQSVVVAAQPSVTEPTPASISSCI